MNNWGFTTNKCPPADCAYDACVTCPYKQACMDPSCAYIYQTSKLPFVKGVGNANNTMAPCRDEIMFGNSAVSNLKGNEFYTAHNREVLKRAIAAKVQDQWGKLPDALTKHFDLNTGGPTLYIDDNALFTIMEAVKRDYYGEIMLIQLDLSPKQLQALNRKVVERAASDQIENLKFKLKHIRQINTPAIPVHPISTNSFGSYPVSLTDLYKPIQ